MLKPLLIVLIALYTLASEAQQSIGLNGQWQFFASNTITEDKILSDSSLVWHSMIVPGNWDAQEKYSSYVGKGYYKRCFEWSHKWKDKQLRIRFRAVYQRSKVWLNGHYIGEHIGGYTPFEFNITEYINTDKPNTLLVMADNSYKRGAWWAWGGISRDVSIVPNNVIRLVYQHIEAIPNFSSETIDFKLKYKLENNSKQNESVQVLSKIEDKQVASFKLKLKPGQIKQHEVSFSTDLSAYDLWDVDHPILHLLSSDLNQGKEVVDSRQDKFGIRKIEARGEQLFLNNKAIKMNGLNRVHDHPENGNTEPDHLVISDMEDIKSLGCDFSRLMHAPLAENILNWCDSVGFLLIEEIPVWGDDDPNAFADNPLTKQWLKEMIERDFNHPCVVGWSVANELRDSVPDWPQKTLTPDQTAYLTSMLNYVDELDTTRLKTYVSLTAYNKTANFKNEPIADVDLICLNSYGNSAQAARNAHNNFSGKPIFMTEVGRTQIGPYPEAKLGDDLIGYMNEMLKMPYVVGISYWCYNDYRSNFKGTPASGYREWGIVDEYRRPKAAYQQLKAVYENKTENTDQDE